MIPENPFPKRYCHGPCEGFESRSPSRQLDDRGVDEAAAQAILRMRSQPVRLARYREVYYKAAWT